MSCAQRTELDQAACRRRALDLLARREHTPLELEGKLAARGYADSVIADTLGALESEGLIDTMRFAETFVQSRINKGQGPVRIRGELLQRGVAESVCGQALDEHDWVACARRARAKKYGEQAPVSFQERMRQSRFLQYRGFTSEQIKHAVAES